VPFLRVIRDKRGYETTYLMHWYREGSRQRSKVLYVFRTPGGVRVGRHAFDQDILREIESQHPDIEFDWSVVRENQQVIEPPAPDMRRRRPKREGGEPPAAHAPAAPPLQASPEQQASPKPPIPSRIEGSTPDEQMAFLAALYPVVRERVAQRTSDPERLQTLQALAERLNPAAWTDADQITSGLQQASEALERLCHVFAKRRRRSRKSRGQRDRAAGAPVTGGATDTVGDPEEMPPADGDDATLTDASDPSETEHQ
jgi:hypothetical protein